MTVTHVTHRRDADDRNDTWVPVVVDGAMHDLHSGAPGKGSDGTPYASW